MGQSPERCSARSETIGEPLAATASTVRRWLLIEHDGPWGERAPADARLPPGLAGELIRIERRLGIRVLLIRRPDRDVAESGTCFLISSGPGRAWIERTRLRRLRDVLALDLEGLARGERSGLEPSDDPLFLVCTHGRHDPCCAERGRPLAMWLSVARPAETWESTHLGGDRFAANLVAFPHGWYFGRVEADAGPLVADAYVDGRVDLAHARGRSCRAIDVQAAELFLRTDRGLDGLDDVDVRTVRRSASTTTADLDTPVGSFAVTVRRSAAPPTRLTCHATQERAAPVFAPASIRPEAPADPSPAPGADRP
jgi:hypothetical protein